MYEESQERKGRGRSRDGFNCKDRSVSYPTDPSNSPASRWIFLSLLQVSLSHIRYTAMVVFPEVVVACGTCNTSTKALLTTFHLFQSIGCSVLITSLTCNPFSFIDRNI